jgi:hypothetical protein
MPGSPTTSTCASLRTCSCSAASFCPPRPDPPSSPSSSPALTSSCPKMDGHRLYTRKAKSRSRATSAMAFRSCCVRLAAVSPKVAALPHLATTSDCSSFTCLSSGPPSLSSAARSAAALPLSSALASMSSSRSPASLPLPLAREPLPSMDSLFNALTLPDTTTTSPGTHRSTRSSISSTLTVRGTRPSSEAAVCGDCACMPSSSSHVDNNKDAGVSGSSSMISWICTCVRARQSAPAPRAHRAPRTLMR